MNLTRTHMLLAAAAALYAGAGLGVAITLGAEREPAPEPSPLPPRPDPQRPSGSQPVPGGGLKERRRRIVADVRAWIALVHADEGEVGEADVRAYLRQHWPSAGDDMQTAVVSAVM